MDNLPKGTHSNIWDKQKQHNQGIGDELWLGEVVAMLNEGVILAEENEQLKRRIGNLEHTKDFCDEVCADCERLENENEQLKHQLQQQEMEYATTCNRLAEENEQLKRENELLSDELEQCKAVIDNRWKEYLDKKGDVE